VWYLLARKSLSSDGTLAVKPSVSQQRLLLPPMSRAFAPLPGWNEKGELI
jgi:hypothetical protein